MNVIATSCLAILFSIPAAVQAQDSVIGKYMGSIQGTSTVPFTVGVTLDIASVEEGKVKGVMTIASRGACRGQYPIAGTYQGDELRVRSTQKGGTSGDCSTEFRGKREGDAFAGKLGENDLTLRK